MLRLTALLFFLSLPPSADAAAQDPRLASRLDSLTLPKVEAVLVTAQRRGLPIEPLVQKALEGASKRAPGPRIVTAVEAMLADLTRAQQGLGRSATADELVAGAAALRAGATLEMVDQLRRAEPDAGVAVPLAVFADLVAGGMAVGAAWRSVEDLAQRGGDDEEFLELRERLRPAGQSP
ncbi:MAG TPA: hypothetical protein VD930_01655 [Gemmatimonadales bacterium]|nr:hypothetical protein [Gemmatimonadales bacterium]